MILTYAQREWFIEQAGQCCQWCGAQRGEYGRHNRDLVWCHEKEVAKMNVMEKWHNFGAWHDDFVGLYLIVLYCVKLHGRVIVLCSDCKRRACHDASEDE